MSLSRLSVVRSIVTRPCSSSLVYSRAFFASQPSASTNPAPFNPAAPGDGQGASGLSYGGSVTSASTGASSAMSPRSAGTGGSGMETPIAGPSGSTGSGYVRVDEQPQKDKKQAAQEAGKDQNQKLKLGQQLEQTTRQQQEGGQRSDDKVGSGGF